MIEAIETDDVGHADAFAIGDKRFSPGGCTALERRRPARPVKAVLGKLHSAAGRIDVVGAVAVDHARWIVSPDIPGKNLRRDAAS